MKLKKLFVSIVSFAMVVAALAPVKATSRVEDLLANMTLQEKVAQMMMVDFRKWGDTVDTAVDFTEMNDEVKKIITDYEFGSIILFANNIKETEQSYNLTKAMQEAATVNGLPLMIAADQEGGSVYRLGSGTALPGNMALGAAGDSRYSLNAGLIIGSELAAVGINTNLAPVVDVNNNANNPVIGLRSYGDDPETVGMLASASIEGMAEYNVIGCAKHFPGHGDTATDSHYGLPVVDKNKDVLLKNELKPFQVAIDEGIEMIMTAHILYPQLEKDTIVSNKTNEAEQLPATMSDDILTKLLKEEMGFDGIVVTDAMNMAGIADKWDQVQSCVVAIQAGVDMICMPCRLYCQDDLKNLDAILNGIVEAVENKTIPMERIDDAVRRILTVKENRGILDYKEPVYTLEETLATVGNQVNRELEREIAAAAVTVIKNENNVLPLKTTDDTKVLMVVPYNNEISQMIMGFNRAKEAGVVAQGAQLDYFRFSSSASYDKFLTKLEWADIIIINSEISSKSSGRMNYGHWLSRNPNEICNWVEENHPEKITVISSVDKPYDVQLYPNADAILAAYGCKGSSVDPTEAIIGGATGSVAAQGPNIVAAVEVAFGTFAAQGKLPVNIPVYDKESNTYLSDIAYERGYGLTYDAKAANKTALIVLLEGLAEVELEEDLFTPASVEAYNQALLAARALKAEVLTGEQQNLVDEAVLNLLAAIEGLTERANKVDLYNTLNVKVELEGMTPDSVKAYKDALAKATAVLENHNATQEEVDEVLAVYNEAVKALVKQADKTDLTAKVETEVKLEGYTQESVNAYLQALEAAKKVLADENATQEEVNAAIKALEEAVAHLELPKVPTETGDFSVIAPYAILAASAAGAYVALRRKED